jgi:hypothetical protein
MTSIAFAVNSCPPGRGAQQAVVKVEELCSVAIRVDADHVGRIPHTELMM